MKQCPKCKTTYTDDSLQYCLSDGANLLALSNDEKTVQMSFANQPMRVNIPSDSVPTVFAPPQSVVQNQSSKKGLGLLLGGGFALLLLLVAAGVGAFIFLRQSDNKNTVVAVSPTPTVSTNVSPTATQNTSPTAVPNDETAKLKEEMANLKKQIESQKSPKQNLTVSPLTSPPNGRTARANSPGDGFLALRSEPDSETGYRITKIPHGAELTVLGCPKPSNVGKMAGRWCQVIYNGQPGWAFDGFMKF